MEKEYIFVIVVSLFSILLLFTYTKSELKKIEFDAHQFTKESINKINKDMSDKLECNKIIEDCVIEQWYDDGIERQSGRISDIFSAAPYLINGCPYMDVMFTKEKLSVGEVVKVNKIKSNRYYRINKIFSVQGNKIGYKVIEI